MYNNRHSFIFTMISHFCDQKELKKKLVKTHLKCRQNLYYQENNRVGDESYYFPQIGLSF